MSADASGLRRSLTSWAARVLDDSRVQTAAAIKAREWVHDEPPAPFDPHIQLHGVAFERDDDPQLANPGSFPRVSHFHTEDHQGCRCITPPLIVRPDGGVVGAGTAAPHARIVAPLRAPKRTVVVTRRRSSTVRRLARQGTPAWWPEAVRREWRRALPVAARRARF